MKNMAANCKTAFNMICLFYFKSPTMLSQLLVVAVVVVVTSRKRGKHDKQLI